MYIHLALCHPNNSVENLSGKVLIDISNWSIFSKGFPLAGILGLTLEVA
jgi:hypothetical protein